MRSFTTFLLALASILGFGQGGPCDQLQAGFDADVFPQGVQFSNATIGTGDTTTFIWTFGDGSTSGDPQPFHTYAQAGTYEACLKVITILTGNNGQTFTCESIHCAPVVITFVQPCALFSVAMAWNDGGNGTVFFTGTSNVPNTQFIWYFGDGTQAFGSTTVHQYDEPGTYAVCLTGWTWDPLTQDTCWVEDCEQIVVSEGGPCEGLQACFTSTPLTDNSFFFQNCSAQQNEAQFFWNFGDGTSGAGNSADHTYTQPGFYAVCLYADWNNCSDSTCSTIQVSGPCDSLMANFGWSLSGASASFDNVTLPIGGTMTWFWQFGDGAISQEMDPDHVFPGPGAYQVCLIATSVLNNGLTCSDTYCVTVLVQDSTDCSNYQACFEAFPLSGMMLFENCSSSPSNAQFFWNFGDGNFAFTQNAEHDYAPGIHTACLTANWGLCADTVCQVIQVGNGSPCDSLNAGFTPFVGGNGVNIQNAVIDPSWVYNWTFGDGSFGYGPNVGHIYNAPGVYEICLTLWAWDPNTQDTCYAFNCELVTIGSISPCDSLNGAFTPVVSGNSVNIQNAVVDQTWSYSWTFGDGAFGFGPNPGHTYNAPGVYDICLTLLAWDPNTQDSCYTYNCAVITIGSGSPCDSLNADFIPFVGGSGVNIQNVVIDPSWIYTWTFGDGTTGYGPNPGHIYNAPGVYEICLTLWAWDPNAQDTCYAYNCEVVTIGSISPCDSLNGAFTPVVSGNSVNIQNAVVDQTWSYSWTFGDGAFGFGPNPGHTYNAPGVYDICLTLLAWDPNTQDSCFTYNCAVVTIGSGSPCDSLNADFTPFVGGNSVNIQNAVVEPSWSYNWSFGDGTYGFGPNTGHTYNAPGIYEICLSLWAFDPNTQDTCYVYNCEVVAVGVTVPCNPDFAVELTWNAGVDGEVFFNATSNLPDTYFIWNFGDGTQGTGPQTNHTYNSPGAYAVCVVGWYYNELAGDSCYTEDCTTVIIPEGGPCDSLMACFNALPFENGAYFFENCTQQSSDAQYYWNFGDGNTATGLNVDHAFQPGLYTVCLTAYWQGCTDETCTTIIVNGGAPGCDSTYASSFTYTVQNNVVIFFANSSLPSDGYVWNFGDGSMAYEAVHTHLYEPPGPFEVCLSTYYWNDIAQDSCWAYSCQLVDPFDISTGLGTLSDTDISVYPVPTNDVLNVTGLPTGTDISLISPDGRLVYVARTNASIHRIPVLDLAPGGYVLRMQNADGNFHRKVVVE